MSSVLVSCLLFCILASSDFRIGYGQTTYNVLDHGAVGDGQRDDTKAFLKAWNAVCLDKGAPRLVIPGEMTFLLQPTKFSGPCQSSSIHVEISGKIVAPSPDAWKECANPWLAFSQVTNLIVSGSGEINGQGSSWWTKYDQLNYVNKVQCERPKALGFRRCDNLQLSGLTHVDSPKAHISIQSCNNATISYLTIRAPEHSPNTDGMDISMSSHVNIHDCNIGTGDDCIAINNASFYININNIQCGPGHGISIGSLGHNGGYETVQEIHVQNCSFTSTMYGARIKTYQGGSGYARKISFEQIALRTTRNPIIIDQFYCNGQHDCQTSVGCSPRASEVTYNGFHGTSENEQAITFNCSQSIGCANIVMNQVSITSPVPSEEVGASCSNLANSITPN
ncbi:LOW QUALITY PROTEIN: probable polygalacturonase At3g15720 [Rosa rugosa]|uniref:LOW QUALITY PROTEIN: probable polygalacturonase At3g15720 n=1 Tax=Rosa rugosa TaxID=74645 RepID=UPI002B40F5E4|nr:LOW QUALITY PROTEIN: probable polygalacturonase At3g15720 [Rosa rugosa]